MKRFTSIAAALIASFVLAVPALASAEQGSDSSTFRFIPGIFMNTFGVIGAGLGSLGCVLTSYTDNCFEEVWDSTGRVAWDFTRGRGAGADAPER